MDRELRELHHGARDERRRLTPDPEPCYPGRPESPRDPLEENDRATLDEDLELKRYKWGEYSLIEPDQHIALDRENIRQMAELAGFEVTDPEDDEDDEDDERSRDVVLALGTAAANAQRIVEKSDDPDARRCADNIIRAIGELDDSGE